MQDVPLTSVDMPHHIQRSILLQLRQSGQSTYQQLKPDGLEGNAYNYHLRGLKKSGLVRLTSGLYELTETGLIVTDAFSFQNQRLVLRPHVYTHLLVTQKDKILLYSPTRQPLLGMFVLPSGKMHYDDSFELSTARELARRNLSSDYSQRLLGAMNVRYQQNNAAIVHRPGMLWHIEYSGPLSESLTPSGSSVWFEFQDILDSKKALPEVLAAIRALQAGQSTAIDLTVDLSVG